MSPPDLNTEEGRAAYRKELRNVGRPLRAGGLAMVVGAAVLILISRQGAENYGMALAAAVLLGLLTASVMLLAERWRGEVASEI